MFRVAPRSRGGEEGLLWEPGSSRGGKGKAPAQSPGGQSDPHRPLPPPVQPASVARSPAARVQRQLRGRGLASPPPPHHFQACLFSHLQQAICQR